MKELIKKQLIEALKDQKETFGDELFEGKNSRRRTAIVQNNSNPSEIKSIPQMKPSPKSKDEPPLLVKEKKIKIEEENTYVNHKEDWQLANNLDGLNSLICNCQKCPLGATRNKFVFGSGNPAADIMVIGEGPGADEDAQGLPFVGRAGKLLTDILKAIKFEREEVYIANVVKCRPPGNRTPLPHEMDACMPYLKKQIELIKPKLILCLGLTSSQGILKKKESLTSMRGKVFDFENAKVMVTFHPAALLRNPNWKRDCWEDVKKFRKLYEEIVLNNVQE